MTNEARTLMAYLQSRADRNTGRGTVLMADLDRLLHPDRNRHAINVGTKLTELESAGEIHDRRVVDGMLSYRVQKD